MQTVLIVVHLLIVLALIGVVLLQRSEGGLGLGGGGSSGTGGFLTGRGQANALTRATAILAGLFFLTSLGLGILAHRGAAPRSIFDQNAPRPNAPTSEQPAAGQGPGVLEQLQRLQQPATPVSPGAPSAPAAPQVPQSR
jgi:preprotein translocase subunit SecG